MEKHFSQEDFDERLRRLGIVESDWKIKTTDIKAYQKAYREKRKEHNKAFADETRKYRTDCKRKNAELQRIKYRELRYYIIEYLGGQCSVCGLVDDNPAVFDCHHRDKHGKSFDISSFYNRNITQELKDEVDKCDLLCCLCHRKIENPL